MYKGHDAKLWGRVVRDETYKEAMSRKWAELQFEIEKLNQMYEELQQWANENDVDLETCSLMICIE